MYNPVFAEMVSMAGRVQQDAMGGEIISKTLSAMGNASLSGLGNRAPAGVSNNADHAFQTGVLNAAYSGKGTFVDVLI
jgi:hypothetical protein